MDGLANIRMDDGWMGTHFDGCLDDGWIGKYSDE